MSVFRLYLELGLHHILDLNGYDHILFLISLCAVYNFNEWKRVLVLITAFTIGHSLTLLLASLKVISVSSELVEFLIPLTILITALFNIVFRKENVNWLMHLIKYAGALCFGLIHGLGFSNYLRSLLSNESGIVKPLLSFNIGIEAGQLIIVLLILTLTWIFVNLLNIKKREWNIILSGIAIGASMVMLMERGL